MARRAFRTDVVPPLLWAFEQGKMTERVLRPEEVAGRLMVPAHSLKRGRMRRELPWFQIAGQLRLKQSDLYRHYVGMLAVGLGKSKKAVANYLGQADTHATERYLHAQESEMWDVARHLEAELAGVLPASDDAAGGES